MTLLEWLVLGLAVVSGITTFIAVAAAGSQIHPGVGIVLGLICGIIVGILTWYYVWLVLLLAILAAAFGASKS